MPKAQLVDLLAFLSWGMTLLCPLWAVLRFQMTGAILSAVVIWALGILIPAAISQLDPSEEPRGGDLPIMLFLLAGCLLYTIWLNGITQLIRKWVLAGKARRQPEDASSSDQPSTQPPQPATRLHPIDIFVLAFIIMFISGLYLFTMRG